MNVLPKGPCTASEWAFNAWGQTAGMGLTVPTDALQVLIDAYVANRGAAALLEQRVKVTLDTSGETVREGS
jgi:hypothetical protein